MKCFSAVRYNGNESRILNGIILSVLWIVFILIGIVYGMQSSISASLMRDSLKSAPSFIAFLLVLVLPVLVSYFALYWRISFLVYLLCSVRGLSLGYCLAGAFCAFGLSGWLIAVLLLTPTVCCQVLLFLFWQRMITCRYWRIDSTVITHAVPLFILAFYYYFKVFPFINELLDFL